MKRLAIFLIICLSACYEKRSSLKTGLEGKLLPGFNLLLPDGKTNINTNTCPIGKPVVLFYFSPECPYCRAQMKEIIDKISLMQNIRFYVFTTWPFIEMKDFYERYQLNKYSNITVGVDYKNFFKYYFKAEGVPYLAIYGKEKQLLEVFMGNVDAKQIKEVTEK